MTTNPALAGNRLFAAVGRLRNSLDWTDSLCLVVLLLIAAFSIGIGSDSFPLQLWDEGRNANNALEMARSGHWLVPTYGDHPDHWNTKPPLLIWQMAALMRLGFPVILAARLPVLLAAFLTVGVVWGVCRYVLRDRLAGVIAGALLVSSLRFTGVHGARTADYDVPLTLLILCYSFAFWVSIERRSTIRIRWFAIFAGGVVLAVMTKGIAGAFALPGLFIFSLVTGRLPALMRSGQTWLLTLLTLGLCLGYYGSRELYDPGYLKAVWEGELGSFPSVLEGHSESVGFYLRVLLKGFEPGMILLPLVGLTLAASEPRRRSIALLCLCCAGAVLTVVTAAQTKLDWYVIPVLQFLAIAAALGVTDGLGWAEARHSLLPRLIHRNPLQIGLAILLGLAITACFYRNQILIPRRLQDSAGQFWYGRLFAALQARGDVDRVIVFDHGMKTLSGEKDYNPMLKLYAEIAQGRGLTVTVANSGAPVPSGKIVATCEPEWVPLLEHQDGFKVIGRLPVCVWGFKAAGEYKPEAIQKSNRDPAAAATLVDKADHQFLNLQH